MGKVRKWSGLSAVVGAGVMALAGIPPVAQAHEMQDAKRVLLISFDGLHEQDVARCIGANTGPNLALLAKSGETYTNPHTIPNALVNGVCTPVYPHNYIKTNTVFEVVKEHIRGARTAWADKHAWG